MAELSTVVASVVLMVVFAASTYADTDANCTYEEIRGTWVFELGPPLKESTEIYDCPFDAEFSPQSKVKVHLSFPDVATDQFGNKGFWTIIYNQGFEVVVGGRKYFAFSAFVDKDTSLCNKVGAGWAHDVLGHDRSCFKGAKQGPVVKHTKRVGRHSSLKFEHDFNIDEYVASINKAQTSWTATRYEQFDGLSREDFISMAGGRMSRVANPPKPAPITKEQERLRSSLPKSFDWRDFGGDNYVSPVRDQGVCGSCFAFASMGMAESRVMIQTNNTQKPVFSPQDIVECSPYAQGCLGGFPYLIAGKHAEDFGIVEEECNPYTGRDGKCSTDKTCARHYITDYKYVGGYFGASNEVAMMEAIYNRGPVAVGFMAYMDLKFYKNGVYHHTEVANKFDPLEEANHAVLVVGWGEVTTPTPDRYWIVKNSWGKDWGNEGYFWMRRGTDECSIESMAVEATPVLRFH